jgi:membrane associated rhomboid family serine protease
MFTFFLFAPHLELALGQNRFLTYYLVCGLGAGVLNNAGSYAENYLKQQAIANYEQAPTAQKFIEYMATHEPQYYKMRLQYCNEYVAHHGTKRSVIFLKEIHKLQKDHHHVVGASGAVFGILMGVLLLLPNLRMPFFYFGMTFRAKHLLPISIILELFAVFGMGGASNVAHFAHLAGAFVGFLLIKFWKLKRIY